MRLSWSLYLAWFLVRLCVADLGTYPPNMTHTSRAELLTQILNRENYKIPPYFSKGHLHMINGVPQAGPTVVRIQLNIYGIHTFNEATMDYSVSLFLQQMWLDHRLYWDHPVHEEPLELDLSVMNDIWIPDLFFSNEKSATLHVTTVPNRMMHLYRNGTVLYSIRLSLKLSCDMDLHNYPFDWQKCGIAMESYGHSTATIIFRWFDGLRIDMNRHMPLPQFYLMGGELKDCTKLYGGTTNYTCLNVTFHLKRKAGYFLIQLYVPSIMIVILSWVSFWLNIDAVPARISLGILTILAMTTQTSGESKSSSKVSYVRAIDVWMFTCLVFVFSSLIEFALVNVFARRLHKTSASTASTPDCDDDVHLIENPQHRKRRPTSSYALGESASGLINIPDPPPGFSSDNFNFRETTLNLLPKPDLENGLLNNGRYRSKRRSSSRTARNNRLKKLAIKKASIFDRISRILFPTLFCSFNLIYWAIYMISYQINEFDGVWRF